MEVAEPNSMSSLSQPQLKRALGVIFLIMLLDIMGITLLYPVAAFIVQRYSSDALMITLLSVIYSAGQFFAAPLFGKLGDRFGRRPVLLGSVFGSAIGYFMFGIGGALWILFLARAIDGITGGNLSTASAYIADVSRPEDRTKNFTLVGIAWGIGLILGPAIGAALGQISLDTPAFTAGILSLLSVVLGFFWLPESLPKARRETAPLRVNDLNPFLSIQKMAFRPGLGRLMLVTCLFNLAFNAVNSIQTLFVIQKFDAQPWQVGLLLVLIGIAVAVVQALLVRRLIPRFGEKVVGVASLIGQAIGAALIFVAPSLSLIYPLTFFTGGVSGFTFPTLTTLASNRVAPHEMGALMGVTTALTSLMSILGPLWAGLAYDHVMQGSPYWIGAIIFIIAALILAQVKSQVPGTQ